MVAVSAGSPFCTSSFAPGQMIGMLIGFHSCPGDSLTCVSFVSVRGRKLPESDVRRSVGWFRADPITPSAA
jgi:hypothetical protein